MSTLGQIVNILKKPQTSLVGRIYLKKTLPLLQRLDVLKPHMMQRVLNACDYPITGEMCYTELLRLQSLEPGTPTQEEHQLMLQHSLEFNLTEDETLSIEFFDRMLDETKPFGQNAILPGSNPITEIYDRFEIIKFQPDDLLSEMYNYPKGHNFNDNLRFTLGTFFEIDDKVSKMSFNYNTKDITFHTEGAFFGDYMVHFNPVHSSINFGPTPEHSLFAQGFSSGSYEGSLADEFLRYGSLPFEIKYGHWLGVIHQFKHFTGWVQFVQDQKATCLKILIGMFLMQVAPPSFHEAIHSYQILFQVPIGLESVPSGIEETVVLSSKLGNSYYSNSNAHLTPDFISAMSPIEGLRSIMDSAPKEGLSIPDSTPKL